MGFWPTDRRIGLRLKRYAVASERRKWQVERMSRFMEGTKTFLREVGE